MLVITDDLRRVIRLRKPATRIISLAPSVTEHAFASGAGACVVGITSYCDTPVAAQSILRVGDFTRPSYERIVSLKPDLVIVESGTITLSAVTELEQKLKVPVFVMLSSTYAAIGMHIKQMAVLTGKGTGVASAIRRLDQSETSARRLSKGVTPPRVLMIISETPLFVAGPEGYLGDIIHLAGGINVVGKGAFPQVSPESILIADPDIIVVGANSSGRPEPLFGPLKALRAARMGKVVCVPGGTLGRPTVRTAAGLLELARVINKG